jgi:hypothetical protein
MLPGWPELSTNDPAYVRDYWAEPYGPRANIGVHCGPSGLLVIDIDRACSYDDMLDLLPRGMDDTFTVRTASGKWHLYFSVEDSGGFTNRVGIHGLPVDIRVNNGYVLGPGSVVNGRGYEIIYDDPVAPLSSRLAEWVKPPPRKKVRRRKWGMTSRKVKLGILQVVLDAPDGELNTRLHWAACRAGEMIGRGEWDQADAEARLEMAATEANLEPWRIGPTIASGIRTGLSA